MVKNKISNKTTFTEHFLLKIGTLMAMSHLRFPSPALLPHPQGPKVKQQNTTQHLKHFTSIPYVQGASERIGRILNEAGVKVEMKLVKTIGNILSSPKGPIAEHEKSRLVYKIPCADCEFVYVGQTKRDLKSCVAEHT